MLCFGLGVVVCFLTFIALPDGSVDGTEFVLDRGGLGIVGCYFPSLLLFGMFWVCICCGFLAVCVLLFWGVCLFVGLVCGCVVGYCCVACFTRDLLCVLMVALSCLLWRRVRVLYILWHLIGFAFHCVV